VVESAPETSGGGGLRSLRMKRALVAEGGGGGNSLVGLDEREEMLVRSLTGEVVVDVEEGLVRKRRTPFMLMGTCKNDALAQPRAGQENGVKVEQKAKQKYKGILHVTPASGWCAVSHNTPFLAVQSAAATNMSTIKGTRHHKNLRRLLYSFSPRGPIDLRAPLLERLDHQPGYPPKKGT
jgi:hypothetical protein